MKRLFYILIFLLSVVLNLNAALSYSVELENKANNGDANSQYLMCHCYIDGLGVKCNYETALLWCEKAANQGHKNALTQMGYFYFSGKGVKKDDKKAFHYFHEASKKGCPEAQFMMARCFKEGRGIYKDERTRIYRQK